MTYPSSQRALLCRFVDSAKHRMSTGTRAAIITSIPSYNVPMTEFLSWDELDTAQQGAAMYGLGFDKSSWDKAHADESTGHALTVSHTDDSDNAVGEVRSSGSSFGMRDLLHVASKAKPWV